MTASLRKAASHSGYAEFGRESGEVDEGLEEQQDKENAVVSSPTEESKASRKPGARVAALLQGKRIGKSAYEHFNDDHDEENVEAADSAREGAEALQEDVLPAPLAKEQAEASQPQEREALPIVPGLNAGSGPLRCFIVVLTLNAAMGGFLFGYDTGVVSGAMLEIRTARQGLGDLTSIEQEIIVSSTIGGAAFGSLLAGEAQRRFWMGRRTAIIHGSVLFTLGAVLMGVAWDVVSLTVGRVLVGLAVGIVSQAVPLYISECAPTTLRGSLNALNSIFIVLGQVVSSLVCCYFARRGTPQGWRWMLGLGALPAVFMCLGFLAMPESPRYLLLSGQGSDAALQKAEAVLRRLRGKDNAEGVGEELRSTLRSLGEDDNARTGIRQALRPRGVRRALLLGCSLQMLQQLCGVNTLMYYSATILQMAGSQDHAVCEKPVPSKLKMPTPEAVAGVYEICMTALVALSQLLGTIAGMVLVDRSGRRPLLLGSLAGVAMSLFVLGVTFHPGGLQAERAPIWAMVIYLISFGIGMAPLPWTVNAEIYPLQARSTCLGIATATNWVANFLVASTFLDLAQALSTDRLCPQAHPDGAFWLYGAFAVAGGIALAVWMPETKGLTLEEISALFDGEQEEATAAAGPLPST